MAYRPADASRGETEVDFAEYDPTPFSGGYDQSAIYGRPKPPSAETCYPISSGKPSYGAGRVDEQRPTYGSERPPQQSFEGFHSGYGKPKPSYGGGYEPEEGYGFQSGHGRPKPKHKPAYQGSFESGDGEEGFESGYGRPPASYGAQFESGYGRPPASYGGQFESDDGYEKPHPHGKPQRPEQNYESGYGGGFGDSYGVSNEQSEESYGGFVGDDYGRKKPSRHGGEEGKYASGGRWKQDEEGEVGSGGRWRKEEEYRVERPGYGGGYNESSAGEWGSGYTPPPPPPEEEGYGGHNRPSGHRWGEGGLSFATESLSLGSEGLGSYEGHHGHKHQKHHWHHHNDDE